MTNNCISCGCEIPEGMQACKVCEAKSAGAKSAWIRVEERLPEVGSGQLLATDGKKIYITYRSWFYKDQQGNICIPANYGAGAQITHWMPLPEPPREVLV